MAVARRCDGQRSEAKRVVVIVGVLGFRIGKEKKKMKKS